MTSGALAKRLAHFRPTVDTKFHIDYDWWQNSGQSFRLFLREQLCDECRARFADYHNTEDVDWVDPETGEVHRTDALRECLRGYTDLLTVARALLARLEEQAPMSVASVALHREKFDRVEAQVRQLTSGAAVPWHSGWK